MSKTELFGIAVSVTMMVCYYLEQRHPKFVLMFAYACLAAAVYAYLREAWSFVVLEIIWFWIALSKYLKLDLDKPLETCYNKNVGEGRRRKGLEHDDLLDQRSYPAEASH